MCYLERGNSDVSKQVSSGKGSLPVSVSGKPLPLARKLRTLLFLDHNVTDSINSLAVMTFGQFLAHDVSLIGTSRGTVCVLLYVSV